MKNFLLISYYWPPSGGVGVQRWLKLCKYLPGQGWKPLVLTPENPAYDLQDEGLLKEIHPEAEIIRLPIFEPYHLINKISGKKPGQLIKGALLENKDAGVADKLMRWVRGNLFIPDPRMFWVRPAARFAQGLLESNQIRVIITTGPPHSMHLIGLKLKEKTGLPWIADFRDPWSQWEILHRMQPSAAALKQHKALERKVVQAADLVLVASPSIGKSLGADPAKIRVLTNGIDPAALQHKEPPPQSAKFIIQYAGILNNKRNPEKLWTALERLCQQDAQFFNDLEIRIAGQVGEGVVQSLKNQSKLGSRMQLQGYLPQEKVQGTLAAASVLLLLIDNDPAASLIIPAKLFEYLAAQKPVLYIGAPGKDAAQILEKEGVGQSFTFDDEEGPIAYIIMLYKEWQEKGKLIREVSLLPYLRTTQAQLLAGWLNELGQATTQTL